jgi:hypothetical protein
MKVDAYGNIKATNATKRRSGVSQAGDFSSILDAFETDGASHAGSLTNVAAPSSLSGMLALQEISDEEIRRKKLVKQGDDMLDSLEQLRRRLLLGTLPMQVLHDINKQLSLKRQEVADPRLIAIMDEIELRTAVELAKLEMAIASKSEIY